MAYLMAFGISLLLWILVYLTFSFLKKITIICSSHNLDSNLQEIQKLLQSTWQFIICILLVLFHVVHMIRLIPIVKKKLKSYLQNTLRCYLKEGRFFIPVLIYRICSQKKFWNKIKPLNYACFHNNVSAVEIFSSSDVYFSCKGEDNCTPLQICATLGHLEVFKYIVEKLRKQYDYSLYSHESCSAKAVKTPLNIKLSRDHSDAAGNSLLHIACKSGKLEIVKYLTQIVGCDPNAVNRKGMSSIFIAVKKERLDILKFLMNDFFVDLRICNTMGKSLVTFAAEKDCLDSLKFFRTKSQSDNLFLEPCYMDSYHNNILHTASKHGSVRVVQYCIEELNFDINSTNDNGKSCVHLCIEYGQLNVLQYLLEHPETDITVMDEHGKTPLQLAADSNNLYIIEEALLGKQPALSNGNTVTFSRASYEKCLLAFCAYGHMNIIKKLVEHRMFDPNCTNKQGMTCLHLAVKHDHLSIVRYLIEKTATDLTAIDIYGRSSAFIAAESGYYMILESILNKNKNCASFRIPKTSMLGAKEYLHGSSLLHEACCNGHLQMVEYLIESCNCDPSWIDESGVFPLYLACQMKHYEIARFLIKKFSTYPDAGISNERTCLHAVCNNGGYNFFKFLICYICDLHCADIEGTTPLYLACEQGHTDIAKYLINHKACDGMHTRRDGRTYLHAASLNGDVTIAQLLVKMFLLEPDYADCDGITSLYIACKKGHFKIAKYFVAGRVCNPTQSCIDAAKSSKNIRLINFLSDQYDIFQAGGFKYNCSSYSCTYVHKISAMPGRLNLIKYHVKCHSCSIKSKDNNGNTPLYYACQSGDLKMVKYLVSYYHCNSFHDWSCLEAALQCGHFSIIEFLLNLNPRKFSESVIHNELPFGALFHAAVSSNIATIEFLIDSMKINANHRTSCKCEQPFYFGYESTTSTVPHDAGRLGELDAVTPVAWSCISGHLEAVKFFIENHSSLCYTDVSLIHTASYWGQLSILQYLIDNCNIDPDLKLFDKTSLFIACRMGHLNVVKFLILEKYCDINFISPKKWNVHHVASVSGKLEIVKFLNEECKIDSNNRDMVGRTPLFLACISGHIDVIKYLAGYHWNSNYTTDDGLSCLHGAIIAGKLDVIKFLITSLKCDSSATTPDGSDGGHLASKYGHLNIIEYLCDYQEYNVNRTNNDGMTCLHVAIIHNRVDIVKYLVSNTRCDVNKKDKNSKTPLYLACELQNIDVVNMFIYSERCDPNIRSNTGLTCLHVAIKKRNVPIMKSLLRSPKVKINDRNKEGQPPLMAACYTGQLQMVQILIKFKGCIQTIKNKCNQTCLHAACVSGNEELVKYLVENWSHVYDINCQDDNGFTPVYLACSQGCTRVVKYLLKNTTSDPTVKTYSTQRTCLHAASASGDVDLVIFLSKLFWPNIKDAEGSTPLHFACRAGHIEIAKFFIDSSHCDSSIITNSGSSCLHEACASGQLEMVKYIISNCKCDINGEDNNGYTPILVACKTRNPQVIEYLVQNHANIAHKTNVGWSSFHIASYYGSIELVRHLAPKFHRHVLESKDNFGITPLYLACQEGHIEIIKYFVEEKNCNMKHHANNGWTCLHAAISTGKLEVIKCISSMSKVGFFYQLLQPFYSSALVKLSSYNPLHIAAEFGQLDIVKYLIEELNYDPISLLPDNIMPIHLASFGGHQYVVKYLSDNCSGVNSTDKYGHTPLHFAAAGGHPHMIEYLVQKHKYDFSTVTSECWSCQQDFCPYYLEKVHSFDIFHRILKRFSTTSLHCAAAYGHVNTLDYLFNVTKCDPLVRDGSGDTLLHVASRNGHLSILKYLLKDKLIDHYVKGACNATAIHSACVNGHLDVVKFLIKEASNDNSLLLDVDKYNRTPLHYACAGGYVNMVHYIRSWVMCDASSMIDNDGNSPLHYAVMRGNIEIIELLMGSSLSDRKFIPRMVNPSLVNLKETPIDLAHADTNCDIKQYFLNQETKDAAYKTPESLSDTSSLNIIVFGSTQVGKTSLVKKLSSNESVNWLNLHFLSGRDSKPYPNPSRTVPHTTTHKKLGSVTFHDMAGEERFHGNHKLILQQVLNPLILLVVSLDKDVKGIDLQLMYWFRLISTAGKDYDIIVVGSFVDKPGAIDKVKFIEEKCREYERRDAFCFRGFVQCNCCVSCKSIENLQKLIVSIRNEIFAEQTENENATIEKVLSPTLFRYLQHLSRYSVSITLEELINRAKNISSPDANMTMLCDIKLLNFTCEYLHKYSRIFYFKHEDVSIEKSVIILDRDLLLKLINNYLMASLEDIKDGVVEEHLLKSNISKLFPQKMFDYDLAVKYLMFSSFCTEISCDKLNSIKKLRSASRYYVFPELISPSIARPECSQLWNTSGETMLWSTLCLKCANEQSFTPELLHALFIKVINKEKDVDNLTLWSNGIGLVHGNGTRSLIEVTDLTTKIYLVLQCKEGNEEDVLHLVNQRSKLFFMVKLLIQNFCSDVEYSESFLYMDKTVYPPENFIEIPFSKVADAIVKGVKNVVLPNNCLVELSKFIYKDFFKEAKREDSYHLVQNRTSAECVPTILLNRLRDLYSTELFQKPLKSAPILYRDLYNKVIQFSIFTDRPVYDICEVPIDIEICKGYFNELGSVALQLLRNNWSVLSITMKFNTDWLAGEMNRTRLLSDDDLENVVRVKSFLTESKRAIIMMISLKKAVASDAQHLNTFLNILKVRPVFYEKSIMLLEECILSVTNLDSLEWNIGNECHCLRICDVISAKWKEVGDFLNLTNDRLEEIALEHQDDVYKCCHSVLEDWLLRDQGSHPKIWETVFQMLHKLEYLTAARELQSALRVKLA